MILHTDAAPLVRNRCVMLVAADYLLVLARVGVGNTVFGTNLTLVRWAGFWTHTFGLVRTKRFTHRKVLAMQLIARVKIC